MSDKSLALSTLTLPVAAGYVPIGAVFGFLFVQSGGPGWLALAASALVYAGAAQFMMVPMLVAGFSVETIVLATLVLNARHVFYGLSLLGQLPHGRWRRAYCVFALTDETYSVLTALPAADRTRHMALACALNQGWWLLGTALGVALGARAQVGIAGLDFVLAALFAVLAVEQWRARRDAAPIWIALAAYAAALALAPHQALLAAMALGIVATAWRQRRQRHG